MTTLRFELLALAARRLIRDAVMQCMAERRRFCVVPK
jgi:hypothetical protein